MERVEQPDRNLRQAITRQVTGGFAKGTGRGRFRAIDQQNSRPHPAYLESWRFLLLTGPLNWYHVLNNEQGSFLRGGVVHVSWGEARE